MKAIIHHRYGSADHLTFGEVPRPAPGAAEVLVRVHAASANALDWRVMHGAPFVVRFMTGLFRPKSGGLGADIAGTVAAVGAGVTAFRPGDRVFGDTFKAGLGGFAEFARARADCLCPIPEGLSFEQAAALPVAGVTALQALRDHGRVQPGHKVLVHGAGGGVGTFAVQIARALGAEVTALCGPANIDRARKLGADHAIDYTRDDFARSNNRYDVILGVHGSRPLADYRNALAPGGRFIQIGGEFGQFLRVALFGGWLFRGEGRTGKGISVNVTRDDLQYLASLVASGRLTPVIDRRYPLRETADAIRYLEQGHAAGKVMIQVAEGE